MSKKAKIIIPIIAILIIALIATGVYLIARNNEEIIDGVTFTRRNFRNPEWVREEWAGRPADETLEILTPISTREEAVYLANQILYTEYYAAQDMEFKLMWVEYDDRTNRWVFGYWHPLVLGPPLYIAIEGDTGEILRVWFE